MNNKNNQNNKPIALITNRKQKRMAEKALKFNGKSKQELNDMIEVINQMGISRDIENLPKFKICLFEGDKVKLNIAKIKSHPSWGKYSKEYKNFVENNEDVIFTVEYNKNTDIKPNIICLKEDTSKQRWKFWDGDLLILDEKDGNFKELYRIERRDSNTQNL